MQIPDQKSGAGTWPPVHEVRGFVSETIAGALREAEAVSRGTKCQRHLYSLSLNPPETESVPVAAFESAIDRIEAKLGLSGHPRIVVFHEKQGRRHAHCVWSRINPETMTAPRLSHDRLKLGDVSRELYIEHGWKMPEGLIDPAFRNPLNFTREEWLKARRMGRDPRDIKAAFRQCWAASDSGRALRQALEARGYYLARGDRRSVVAVDSDGEAYALARWTGIRTKDIAARLSDLSALPSVTEAKERVSKLVREKVTGFLGDLVAEFAVAAKALDAARQTMVVRHRAERAPLDGAHRQRHDAERDSGRRNSGRDSLVFGIASPAVMPGCKGKRMSMPSLARSAMQRNGNVSSIRHPRRRDNSAIVPARSSGDGSC